jgi:hypothetical protein
MNSRMADLKDRHVIEALPVLLVGGPDDGELLDVRLIHVIDGMRAVSSRYSQGFSWLPEAGVRDSVIWPPARRLGAAHGRGLPLAAGNLTPVAAHLP